VNVAAAGHSLAGAVRHWRSAGRPRTPEAGRRAQALRETTLVVPCCGAEDGLEANLEALVGQGAPPARVLFVVERAEDGAVPVIERVRTRHPGRSELVVAGPARGQGQKVHNLLAAVDRAGHSEVLVFADSDGRPEAGWMGRLVRGLDAPGTGVTSTYRFYRPTPATFATLLRSVWNLSVLALFGEHDRNFAWGGGMAIRREVFERARVREEWRGALSDDYALSHAVRRAGLRVVFVPECVVGSHGGVALVTFLSWSARQISITRVYWPRLFRLAALGTLPSAAFLVLAPVVGGLVPLALLVLVLSASAATGGLRALALARRAPHWRADLRRFLWAYALLAPLCGLVTAWGVVRSLATRRIEWRGKVYEMRSPRETVILAGEPPV
jgi:ceramide glucosyltransferase